MKSLKCDILVQFNLINGCVMKCKHFEIIFYQSIDGFGYYECGIQGN